ncbi:MAG: hypothetical protein QW320_11775 [Ignisphaera sp.]
MNHDNRIVVDSKSSVMVSITVKCFDGDGKPFEHFKKFFMPRHLWDAINMILVNLHINRAFDIPDANCSKELKLNIRDRSKLGTGFYFLLDRLKTASKNNSFSLVVEGDQ